VDRLLPATATSPTSRSAFDWIRSKGYALGADGYLHRAPVAQSSTNAARRDRKLVKSAARRAARRAPTFPLSSSDLRNTGAMGVQGFSSGESAAPPNATPNSPLTAPHKHRTAPSTAPLNDNEDQKQKRQKQSQKNGRAQFRITTPKEKIAADILASFRRLEYLAGNDRLYAFTLRIHPAIFDGVENPANHMQRIIARRLKEFLGRDVKFSGALEWRTDGAPELHVHSVILLPAHELERAGAALKAAGGKWRRNQGSANQVDIRPIDPQVSYKGKFGLEGWALYCADDSRQTQLELDRRRQALDPQKQHHRAPSIVMRSGLQNSRRVSKQAGESVSKQITPGVSKQLDNKTVSKPSPVIVSKQANLEEPMAKSMAERMKDHHAKRKREWAELQAERDALRAEVADLRHQIAERADPPAIEKAERRARKSETIDVVATRIGEKFAEPEPVTDPFMAIDAEAILPAPVAEPKPKVETRSAADVTDKILADIAAKFHAPPVTPRPVAAPKPKPVAPTKPKPKPVAPTKQTETEAKPVADLYKADPEWGAY
jgi:polyhydroxyalkanoate synthesis regulator phasin